MGHDRTIDVSSSYIARASKEQDFFLVLGACLIIKATFVNSVISDFSYRKFAKLLGKRFNEAKEIVSLGIKYDMLKLYTKKTKNGHHKTYLRANKLYDVNAKDAHVFRGKTLIATGSHKVRFGAITPSEKYGKKTAQVFLLSSKSPLSKKYDNYERYKKTTDKLTLSRACDLLLFAAILPILRGNEIHRNRDLIERLAQRGLDKKYRKLKSKKQMQSMRNVILDEFKKGEANVQNTGISYKRIARNFQNLNGINEYQIGKVIRRYGIGDSLLEASQNFMYVGDCKPGRHNDEITKNAPKFKSAKEIFVYAYEEQPRLIKEACLKDYHINHYDPFTSEVQVIDCTKRGIHAPKRRKRLVVDKDGKVFWKSTSNPNRFKILMRMANSFDLTCNSSVVVFSHETHKRWRKEKQERYNKKTRKEELSCTIELFP